MGLFHFQPDLENIETDLKEQYKYQYKEESELFGYPIHYIKPEELESNTIFNESTSREFIRDNSTQMFCKRDEDSMFSGSEVYGGFGYQPSYTNVLYVAVLYFEGAYIEPQEGDLIYDSTDHIMFEVTKVDSLTDTQSNLRMNETVFARKLYCKQYTYSYKDSFDTTTAEESFDDSINIQELDKLNDTLRSDINTDGNLDLTKKDDIFGDFG